MRHRFARARIVRYPIQGSVGGVRSEAFVRTTQPLAPMRRHGKETRQEISGCFAAD